MKLYDAYQQFPNIVNRLQGVNARLSASTSAAIALIFKGKTNDKFQRIVLISWLQVIFIWPMLETVEVCFAKLIQMER